MGWKWGCQPCSCRCWQNVRRCRKEICSTCLFEESIPAIPFWNSTHPIPTRSLRFLSAACLTSSAFLHHAHPRSKAFGPRLHLQRSTSSALCFFYACKRFYAFVEDSVVFHGHGVGVSKVFFPICHVEYSNLLAAVGWKWGCQPFSCPCSQNVTQAQGYFFDILVQGIPAFCEI